ncbi:MAG: hypothetical protein ACD_75C00408G0005 [uncultured bacterium]|nr:MAG: hypothetical protein ACD_75C00408G0005 [uncultured bacterium]
MSRKKKTDKEVSIVRSSAAEYLTFVAASGTGGVEAVYADESIWLTQKMMGVLHDVETQTVNYHLRTVLSDGVLAEDSVIRNFRITAADGKILQDAGKVTAEIAKAHAESEFEKYRIVQDRLFESDFNRMLKQIEALQKLEGGDE